MRAELPMACKKKTKTKIMLNWKKVTKRRSGMTMKAEKKEKSTVEMETEQMNTKVVQKFAGIKRDPLEPRKVVPIWCERN